MQNPYILHTWVLPFAELMKLVSNTSREVLIRNDPLGQSCPETPKKCLCACRVQSQSSIRGRHQ